jgi:hypothetical protein
MVLCGTDWWCGAASAGERRSCPRSLRWAFAFAISYLLLRGRLSPGWWLDPPETQSPAVRVGKRALSLPLIHPRPRLRLQTPVYSVHTSHPPQKPWKHAFTSICETRFSPRLTPTGYPARVHWVIECCHGGVKAWVPSQGGQQFCSAIRLRRRNRAQGPRCLRGVLLMFLGGCVSHNKLHVQPTRRPQRKPRDLP